MQRCRWALAALLCIAVGCSGVEAPRWHDAAATGPARSFDSPRQEFVVEASPDIGTVSVRGTVRGQVTASFTSPADGMVLEVLFSGGDAVGAGEPVLSFRADPSPAELIELDIAQLQVDLAVAQEAAAADVAVLESLRDELHASFEDRTEVVTASADGVIGATRRNISYSVDEGDTLFELADPDNTFVEIIGTAIDLASVTEGSRVNLASSNASTEGFRGTVEIIEAVSSASASAASESLDDEPREPSGRVRVQIRLDEPELFELGDRLIVSLPVSPIPGTQWVPLDAVGRRDGSSFVLAADSAGQLERLDVRLGRRTATHVEILNGLDDRVATLVAP